MANGLFKFTAAAVVVGTALYAGIGYLGIPYATRTALDQLVSAKLGRTAMLEDVRFNPWTWTYEIKGLDIPKKSGGSLVHLDRLLVDASAQTILKFAPVLDQIAVDGLKIDAVMDDALKADIAALTGSGGSTASTDTTAKATSSEGSSALPGFALYNISVTNSSIRYADASLGIDQAVTDIALSLPFVSTLESSRESLVTPTLSLKLNGTPIEATGSTKPFGSSLEAMLNLKVTELDVVPLAKLAPMLSSEKLHVASGKLSSDLNLIFRNPTGGEPAKMLLSGSTTLDGVSIVQGSGKSAAELIGFKTASVALKEVNFVSQNAAVDLAQLDGLRVNLRNDKSGLNVIEAISTTTDSSKNGTAGTAASNSESTANNSSGWQWSLAQAQLKNGTINWLDNTVKPAAKLAASNINVSVHGLGSAEGQKATLDASVNLIGGRVTAKGNVAITPLAIDASVTGSKLSTKSLTSYIKSATNLDIAALADFGIKLKYADNVQTVSGSATIADISVKDGKKTFLTAKKASASLSSIDLLKQNADVSSVAVDGLSVHAVNTKQGFDLAQLGQKNATTGNGKPNAGNEQSKAAAKGSAGASSSSWQWKVGSATLSNSSFTLRDETLKPAANLALSRINATVKNLSSTPKSTAVLDVALGAASGTVNAAGSFGLSPLSVNVDLEAANLQLKDVSPFLRGYTGLGAKKGAFAMSGKLTVNEEKEKPIIGWKGNMSLADLDLTNAKNTTIMSWTKASLSGMEVATTEPLYLVIAKAEIEQPAKKQTQAIREVAGIASIISAIRGKEDTAKKIDKYSDKLAGTIHLENIRYENGQLSADGVSASSIAGIMLKKLSDAIPDSKQTEQSSAQGASKTTSKTTNKK